MTGQRTTTPPASVFSPHLTILTLEREDGPCRHLDLLTVLTITQRWREAILSRSNELPPHIRDLLSGHERNGSPLECPHPALAALASIGHRGADGRLHGLAVVLPDRTSHEDLRLALRAVGRIRRLVMGRLGVWSLEPQTAVRPESPLRPETWTAHPDGATHWSTVTPVVFDRHPKTSDRAAYQREVAAMIATSCTRIGLPEPREAIPTPVSAHLGVPPAHVFPKIRRKDNSERRHTHAILVFDEPVCGPILIGAGRYRGYGLCRPICGETGA